MKDELKFAFRVLVALVIINFVLDFVGPTITAWVYSPGKALGIAPNATA